MHKYSFIKQKLQIFDSWEVQATAGPNNSATNSDHFGR